MCEEMCLLATSTSWSFMFRESEMTRKPASLTNKSESEDGFHLFQNCRLIQCLAFCLPPLYVLWLVPLFGLLFMCVVILLALAAMANKMETHWLTLLSAAFTLQPDFIQTKIIKLYDCLFRCSVSFPWTITLSQEDDYYSDLIGNIKEKICTNSVWR